MLTSRSWAFRLSIAACLQGVLVVQTIAPRVFREDEVRMLTEAAAQVAPVVSEARTLDRFIAPAQERLWALARNLWWCWDHDTSSLFRDLDPGTLARAGSQSGRPAFGDSAGGHRTPRPRTGAAQPDQLRLSPPARISGCRPHLGSPARRHSAASSGGVFLGGVRFARFHSGIFRRPGRAGRRPHQERVRPGHSAGRHRLVLWPGIFPPAAGPHRLAAGRIHPDRCQPAAHGSRHRTERRTRHRAGGDPRRPRSAPKSGA